MDVDSMSTEQKNAAMKEGRCFKCNERGHLARNCPGQKKKEESPPIYTPPKKKMGKELHTQIRALMKDMEEDEKEKFFAEAEEQGF
jgi:hypothetical protein